MISKGFNRYSELSQSRKKSVSLINYFLRILSFSMCGDRGEAKQIEPVLLSSRSCAKHFFLPSDLWECDRLSGKKAKDYSI